MRGIECLGKLSLMKFDLRLKDKWVLARQKPAWHAFQTERTASGVALEQITLVWSEEQKEISVAGVK